MTSKLTCKIVDWIQDEHLILMTYGKVLLACMTGQLPLTATFTPILSEHLKTNEIE